MPSSRWMGASGRAAPLKTNDRCSAYRCQSPATMTVHWRGKSWRSCGGCGEKFVTAMAQELAAQADRMASKASDADPG